jgi:uncharacterized protein with PIN domain
MEEVKKLFDQVMEWEENAIEPSLIEIENRVLELRKKLGEKLMKTEMNEEENCQSSKKRVCFVCGGELESKGSKEKRIETQLGSIKLKRKYNCCPNCRKGFFPPA